MRLKIKPIGIILIACALLFGCTAGDLDVFEKEKTEEAPSPAIENAENLDGWHRVDVLGIDYYASNKWAEEVSRQDPNWKTVNYPLSNGQYYTISVDEYDTSQEDLDSIAANTAEELELVYYEADKLLKNYQIQVEDWSNGEYDGKMISYCTKYYKDYYSGYLEGYKDIIQNDTSYGKILILLSEGKTYEFRITAYRDVEDAFGTFDKLTASIGK